jgi:hypothetical protein
MESPKDPSKPEEPTQPTPSKVEQLKSSLLSSPLTQNAIKLAGEALLPGASLLMDGKIVHGGVHLVAGAVARTFLGPVGVAVVIGNSYSNSTTGKNLLEQFSRFLPPKATE